MSQTAFNFATKTSASALAEQIRTLKGAVSALPMRACLATPIAVVVALLALFAAQGERPLPAAGAVAIFLLLAVERDVRENRIPNWLTFPCFALVLAHAGVLQGLPGLWASVLGAGLGLGLLMAPYASGALGAGDVKAAMVLGGLWGAGVALSLIAWSLILGGVLGFTWLAVHGALGDVARRWYKTIATTLWASATARRWISLHFPPAAGSPAAGGLPFAVALGLAVALHQLFGPPWSVTT